VDAPGPEEDLFDETSRHARCPACLGRRGPAVGAGPGRLAEMNPMDFREHVTTRQEYEQLRDYWRAASVISAERPDPPQFWTNQQALEAAMADASINPNSDTGRRFARRAQELVEIATAEKGEELTPSERNEALQRAGIDVTLNPPGIFNERTAPAGAANLGADFEGVPSMHQTVLADVFAGSTMDPTPLRQTYDAVVADLSASGFDLSGPDGAAFLRAELEDARLLIQVSLEQQQRAAEAEAEAQARAQAEARAEARDEAGEGAGLSGVLPSGILNPQPGSFGSPEMIREALQGAFTFSGPPREEDLRGQLGRLGYPPERIDQLVRPLNRQLAARLVRQGTQYQEGE